MPYACLTLWLALKSDSVSLRLRQCCCMGLWVLQHTHAKRCVFEHKGLDCNLWPQGNLSIARKDSQCVFWRWRFTTQGPNRNVLLAPSPQTRGLECHVSRRKCKCKPNANVSALGTIKCMRHALFKFSSSTLAIGNTIEKSGLQIKFSKILLCNLCNALHDHYIFYSLKIFLSKGGLY